MNYFIMLFEIIGTISFAVSGAIVAIKKNTDVFGVIFLSLTTAVGGGIIRDILIGKLPPLAFVDGKYAAFAIFTSLIVFISIKMNKNRYNNILDKMDSINLVFDSLGLGTFTVIGAQSAMNTVNSDILLVAFLGMITGIGGGILRDIMVARIPFVLKKRIYAVASLLGAVVYYELKSNNIPQSISLIIGIIIVFGIRMASIHFKWELPKIHLDKNEKYINGQSENKLMQDKK